MSADSTLGIESYGFDGFQGETDNFSPVDGLPRIQLVDAHSYYDRPLQLDRPMQAPRNIYSLLASYCSLPASKKERFMIAAFWFHQAAESQNKSVAFLNLIYAIDSLVPEVAKGPLCEKCNRPARESDTAKFIHFLARMAPEETTEKGGKGARKTLLRIRGKLAHGKSLLFSDRESRSFAFNPEGMDEITLLRDTKSLARRVLVNWLVENGLPDTNLS